MKRGYSRITKKTIRELKDIISGDIILLDADNTEDYSHDEAPVGQRYMPLAVIKPSNTFEICGLLKIAHEERIPITPRGGGTGLSGGCTPVKGGIVLSLERMNRIIQIDSENFTATVEPGVTLAELHQSIEKDGLSYPIHLGEYSATIGGTVATNAGGINAVKYGVTRNHILGLEAVLADGSLIKTGGTFVKSTSGYDLTQLIIGSEGTLAVVTKIMLKLTALTTCRDMLLVPFSDLKSAIDTVPYILHLKEIPTGIEFMGRDIIEIVEKDLGKKIPYSQGGAFLMITQEGQSEDEIHHYFREVDKICQRYGAFEAVMPGTEHARRGLLEMRERFYHALRRYAPIQILDVVVPRREIARYLNMVNKLGRKHGIPIISYGHAGDGNMHLHPLCKDIDRDQWDRDLGSLMEEVYRAGIACGGAISGEHGIGLYKKKYLPIQIDRAQLAVMKAVKKAFDPENILNPGKIFDI
jgi:glycolate oxidase